MMGQFQAQFQTKVNGKWILAGEHAVLRGSPALVFPLYSRGLEFSFEPKASNNSEALQVELNGEHGEELQLLFWGVLEKACSLRKIYRQEISGKVKITSSIPVGAGLGASAALSVAVAKWFHFLKVLSEAELLEFSRQLENLFHGESSGVDLAVALSGQPLRYQREAQGGATQSFFKPQWRPQWFVSYSGKRGVTMECVNRVKLMIKNQPELGLQIDQDMRRSVALAEAALAENEQSGLPKLIESLDLARSCFERWGLTEGHPDLHMRWLKDQGALAVKPTGSGNGGYVLSLWNKPAPAEALTKLIPCF